MHAWMYKRVQHVSSYFTGNEVTGTFQSDQIMEFMTGMPLATKVDPPTHLKLHLVSFTNKARKLDFAHACAGESAAECPSQKVNLHSTSVWLASFPNSYVGPGNEPIV